MRSRFAAALFLTWGATAVPSRADGVFVAILAKTDGAEPVAVAGAEVSSRPAPIVNGVFNWTQPAVGALLEDAAGQAFCTGTLIGCQTVLTAAHCFCKDPESGQILTGSACRQRPDLLDPTGRFVFFQHYGSVGIDSIEVNPSFVFTQSGDVALLRLSQAVTGLQPVALNHLGRLPAGTSGLITGFGRTSAQSQDGGLKRTGLVATAPCASAAPGSHVCWSFTNPVGQPGLDSSTCRGDSGGPLFVAQGATTLLAGVTAGATATCLAPDHAFAADVYLEQAWIQANAGSALGQGSCGPLANAGSPAAPILAALGALTPADAVDRFSLTVPAGLADLTVTMNGAVGDAELYLKRGSPPTSIDYLCASELPGTFEECFIPSPAAGIYHVLVQRLAGSGQYQLTATMFSASAQSSCTPDSATLCLDDQPGDRRFKVNIFFQTAQAGGLSGPGRAISLAPLGVDRGGLFWFFSPDNPEFLIKVLDGCGINGSHWVFFSAGTNVGLTLTVTDTVTGRTFIRNNPDGTAVPTVQDTAALPCS
jgi:hypothetical protein